MESPRPAVRPRCSTQNYDWGRSGQSTVAGRRPILAAPAPGCVWARTTPACPSSFQLTGRRPTTRPSPSKRGSRRTLAFWERRPWPSGEMSFLSCSRCYRWPRHHQNKHTRKELANVLHQMRPILYRDHNHKPEMSCAITEFQAWCGFVSFEELKSVFISVPEIVDLVGEEDRTEIINVKDIDEYSDSKSILQ